jgi:hypothetical protein
MSEPPVPADDASFDDAVEALLASRGDADDAVAAALRALGAAAQRPAPKPSAALAELFAAGISIDEVGRRRRAKRGIVAGIAAAGATTTLALSGVAAAHDALPGAANGVVSGIIDGLTPFGVDPDRRGPEHPTPTDTTLLTGVPAGRADADDRAAGGRATEDGAGFPSGAGSADPQRRFGSGDSDADERAAPGDTDGRSGSPDGERTGATTDGGPASSGDGDSGSSGDSGSATGAATPSPSPSATGGSDGGDGGDGSGSGGSGDGSGSQD